MRHWLFLIGCFASLPLWALDINQASEAELDNLRGVGPAFTRRILAQRDIQAFASWPDLMKRVSGMGVVVAKKLSDQGLTVNGKSYLAPVANERH